MIDSRTEAERRLGLSQRYVNAGHSPLRWRNNDRDWGMNRAPADFRKVPGRKPVKGGRWGVRKIAARTRDGLQWHAYTRGTTKGLSARFATQEEAVAHAQKVAALKRGLTQ